MASVFVVGIEMEELAHEVEPGEVVRAVAGAQAAAGVMEDLADQRAGQALELRVGLLREAGEDLGQLLEPDALRLLLHAGDQRLGFQPAEPGAEVGQLLLDDLLGARELLPAPLQVALDQVVERVDGVEEDVLGAAGGRLDVARHPEVDHQQRPRGAGAHRLGRAGGG